MCVILAESLILVWAYTTWHNIITDWPISTFILSSCSSIEKWERKNFFPLSLGVQTSPKSTKGDFIIIILKPQNQIVIAFLIYFAFAFLSFFHFHFGPIHDKSDLFRWAFVRGWSHFRWIIDWLRASWPRHHYISLMTQ